MNSNIMHFTSAGRDISLIGTAHVSKESIEEVTETINSEKPDMVCVELDQGRYSSITQQNVWEKLNVSKILKEGKGFLLIVNMVLTGFQRRLGNELGVKPGAEMIAAVNTAEGMNIPFSLCDREVQITLRRAWNRCSFWSKCKLLAALFSGAFVKEKLNPEEIEKLKKGNELENMMEELSSYLPAIKETLIDERDAYLAARIWKESENNPKTLAVVGAGHMRGILEHFEKFKEGENLPDLEKLNTTPKRSIISRSIKWLIPAAILSLIAIGFFKADFKDFSAQMINYFLWNGGLAALGSIIALGHPLSIIVSFLCAPFTTLIPFVGVGMISGLVQAAICKPKVSDAENISADSASLKGMYRNRITRVLLVFLLSSIGSSIATFVSGSVLVNFIINVFKGS